MRRSSLKLALLASAPLALLTTTAWAQDPVPTPPAQPPAQTPPATTPPPAATGASQGASQGETTTPTAPTTPPPATGEAATPPPAASEGTVMVHIDASRTVTLERRGNASVAWEHACDSPCDQRLPVSDEYRIVGTNMNESNPFMFQAQGDKVSLKVGIGDKGWEKAGTYVLIGGAVVFLGGLIGGLAASHPSGTFTADGTTNNNNWNAILVGTSLALAGLSAGLLGAGWMYNNAHSRVGGDVQGVAPSPARGDVGPAHRTGLRTDEPQAPVFNFPVFHGTF